MIRSKLERLFAMRRLAAILIVLSLLLCPVRCMGVLRGGADRAGGEGLSTCDCGACGHSRESPSDPPATPQRDKGCDSCQCVCAGAVVCKDVSAEMTIAVDFFARDLEPIAALPPASECQLDALAAFAGLPPGACSGRELRVRLASLVC